jgi:hypothetical protein
LFEEWGAIDNISGFACQIQSRVRITLARKEISNKHKALIISKQATDHLERPGKQGCLWEAVEFSFSGMGIFDSASCDANFLFSIA